MKKAEKVCVVGAGTMGRGIAHVCAQIGKLDVRLVDISHDRVQEAIDLIRNNLERNFVKKGRLTKEEAVQAVNRIKGAVDLQEVAHDADYAVEAVFEDEDVKRDIFRKLDEVLPPDAVISSNTSVLSITRLASATGRPDRCIGTHFAAPVPRMRLCEVVRGLLTSDETVQITTELIQRIGKPVLICSDTPGFLANRMLIALYKTAIDLIAEGNRPEDVDRALMDAVGWHVGPVQIMDNAGLDIVLAATEAIHKDLGFDPAFRPHPLLRRMVDAGLLGRKKGRGFFVYDTKDQL